MKVFHFSEVQMHPHLVNQRFVFSLENNLESTGGVISRVKPNDPSRLPEISEPDMVLKISLLNI